MLFIKAMLISDIVHLTKAAEAILFQGLSADTSYGRLHLLFDYHIFPGHI